MFRGRKRVRGVVSKISMVRQPHRRARSELRIRSASQCCLPNTITSRDCSSTVLQRKCRAGNITSRCTDLILLFSFVFSQALCLPFGAIWVIYLHAFLREQLWNVELLSTSPKMCVIYIDYTRIVIYTVSVMCVIL